MKYAIEQADGGVSIMEVLPTRARNADKEYRIERIVRVDNGFNIVMDDRTTRISVPDLDMPPDGWAFFYEAVADIIARWGPDRQKTLKQPLNCRELADAHIPSDREFRDAWSHSASGPLGIDMAKARAIHRSRIVQAQMRGLAVLERESRQALVEGRAADATRARDNKATIDSLDLNTLATAVQNAQDVSGLKAVWPAELERFRQ